MLLFPVRRRLISAYLLTLIMLVKNHKAFKDWIYHILEHGATCVVLQASANCGIKCFWSRVIDTCRGLRCKLRMMGVALSGPTFVNGDNMSVFHNTQRPESVLKKKSNSICYHAVRESAVMGESIIGHVPSVENPADICTNFVPGGQKRNHLIRLLLHYLCD
jgi:hypothetical protein